MTDEVKWIKLSTGILDDEKIIAIEEEEDGSSLCWMWIKLLALAGKQNNDGCISLTEEIPYTRKQLANRFRMPVKTVEHGLQQFQEYGMIEIIDDMIYTSNWLKYQNQESLEKIREKTRERVRKHREKNSLQKRTNPDEANIDEDVGTELGYEPGELQRIQEDHNALLDLADYIKVTTNDWQRDRIIELYAEYGREKVEYALNEAGKHNKTAISYVQAICKNYGKKKEDNPIMAAAQRSAERKATCQTKKSENS